MMGEPWLVDLRKNLSRYSLNLTRVRSSLLCRYSARPTKPSRVWVFGIVVRNSDPYLAQFHGTDRGKTSAKCPSRLAMDLGELLQTQQQIDALDFQFIDVCDCLYIYIYRHYTKNTTVKESLHSD